MAFKRKESVIEATDLNTIAPDEAEKRIIAGVKKYATNEANFSKADANTPYLGHIIGMGIESSNLADITMSIERQFLTKMTTRVPVSDGSAEFKLEAGELGKLRILDGQDALAATPGLSIKMLMDLGHMPKNDAYLSKVVSFAYIAAIGDGYKLADAVKKMAAKTANLSGPEKDEALANLKTMVAQAKAYDEQMSDASKLAAARQKTFANDQAGYDALKKDLDVVLDKIKGASASNDAARVAALRAEEAEVRTRLKMSGAKLNVSREVAQQAGKRSGVEQAKVDELRKILADAVAQAEKL
jgi:muconolactone delta-isomerase